MEKMTGITPLDAAYSYGGYIVAGQLMKKLLPVYIAIVSATTIWIIYKGILEHSLKPVVIYLITVGLLVSFFIPEKEIIPSSATSQSGAPVISTSQEIANSMGYAYGQSTSTGLSLLGETIDGITIYTIKGIENISNIAQSEKYIGGSPFSAIYADNMILSTHISNIQTRNEFIGFLKGPFTRAITQCKNSGTLSNQEKNIWYPGNWKSYYTPKELQEWETIKQGIISDAQQRYGKFKWWQRLRLVVASSYMYKLNSFDNDYIRWVANNEIRNDAQGITGQLTKGLGRGPIAAGITNAIGEIGRFFSKLLLQLLAGIIIPALPAFQGAICFIVLSFFPIIFLISLFPSSFSWISWYFLTLFWVKSWSIGWAILNVFQNLQWCFFQQTSPVYAAGFNQMPYINNMNFITIPLITLILIFVIPLIEWELLSKGRATIMAVFTDISAGGKMISPVLKV